MNTAADRRAAAALENLAPGSITKIRQARASLIRAAEWAAREHRITAYIESGAWLPGDARPLHDIIRDHVRDATVVYIQRDPVAAAHLRDMAAGAPGTHVREPGSVRAGTGIRALRRTGVIGEERVCVLMPLQLQFMTADRCERLLAVSASLLPAGSVIYVTVGIMAGHDAVQPYVDRFPAKIYEHSTADIARWIRDAGMVLEEPGVSDCQAWRSPVEQPLLRRERYGRIVAAAGVKR